MSFVLWKKSFSRQICPIGSVGCIPPTAVFLNGFVVRPFRAVFRSLTRTEPRKLGIKVLKKSMAFGLIFGTLFKLRFLILMKGKTPSGLSVQIRFPSGIQLLARIQSATGAAGPDGWIASELKLLPLAVFDVMAKLFEDFALQGSVPVQLQQARMPKPGKVKDSSINVSDTRPISICSVWYRLWASTLCQSYDLQCWLRNTILPEVGGISKQDIYEQLLDLYDSFNQHGCLLGLDFSKAFDCINSDLSCEILKASGWPPSLVNLLGNFWGSQSRFIQWDHHTYSLPLNGSKNQPQGDPVGPLMMTLWVQCGIKYVRNLVGLPQNTSITKTYLDDRSVTACTPEQLQTLHVSWKEWSQKVGLLENEAKAVATAVGKNRLSKLSSVFPAHMVQSSVAVLGSVTCSGRRQIHATENRRVNDARSTARLLGCCGFGLDTHLRYLRQFSLSKVNYGWVARGPTWSLSKSLWSCFWQSARRVRYSSPWLRALFLGGNLHLDVVWVTRLVSAVLRFRLSQSRGPVWSMKTGSCAHALRSWMSSKNFTETRPWVWHHVGANVTVDLAVQPTSVNVGPLIGLASHNCRQGWRSWVFQKWLESGRRELRFLPVLSQESFRRILLDDTRAWLLSAAPAATVALGATFSPATWGSVPSASQSTLCPRGCGSVGYWSHVCWDCPLRPCHAPPRPTCPLLARFGWSSLDTDPVTVSAVRVWLVACQNLLWQTKDPDLLRN